MGRLNTKKTIDGRKSLLSLPVYGDGHHVHQGGRNIPVEEEREDPTERGSQCPCLVNVPRQQFY